MRRILIILSIFLALAGGLMAAPGSEYFNKGITYILIKDIPMARRNLEIYFSRSRSIPLRNAFMQLINGENREAIDQLETYLDMNPRSPEALVGIALATAEMPVSNTLEVLDRTIRLDPNFSIAYLCLGMEYLKKKDYPKAEKNLNIAINKAKIPEYKIPLGELYLLLNEFQDVINLVAGEASRFPDNFYFNYLLARAYFKLNRLSECVKFLELAIEAKPTDNDAKLLMARYYVNAKESKKARSILESLKFEQYNREYIKTYAQVLLELRDNKVENHLYEFFVQDKWDRDINRFMAIYFQWKKGKGNIQNWITRAILSGNPVAELKTLFPGPYQFPEYPSIPFFEVKKIEWFSGELLMVVGVEKSGEKERLFLVDPVNRKIMRALDYRGRFQALTFSADRAHMVMTTVESLNESINLYAIKYDGKNMILKPIFSSPRSMAAAAVGFDLSGTLAYITNAAISTVAFESPFSLVSPLGKKTPVYPGYPFPVYKYNFATGTVGEINDLDQLKRIKLKEVQKYYLVSDANQLDDSVRELIKLGLKLDITSTEVIKIYFAEDLSSFVIYLSDLQNAFQAAIYDSFNNKSVKIDETMFLGKGKYAELQILEFNPKKKRLLFLTRGQERNLIRFNYESFLHSGLSSGVKDFCWDEESDMIYVLTERSKKLYFSETGLEVISLDRFSKKRISTRRDLDQIVGCYGLDGVLFSTYNGELIQMGEDFKFEYRGTSFSGCPYALSPDQKKKAAFINDRLFLIE